MMPPLYFTHMFLILHLWTYKEFDNCIKWVLFQCYSSADSECFLGWFGVLPEHTHAEIVEDLDSDDLIVEYGMNFFNSRDHLDPQWFFWFRYLSHLMLFCYIHSYMVNTWENSAYFVSICLENSGFGSDNMDLATISPWKRRK